MISRPKPNRDALRIEPPPPGHETADACAKQRADAAPDHREANDGAPVVAPIPLADRVAVRRQDSERRSPDDDAANQRAAPRGMASQPQGVNRGEGDDWVWLCKPQHPRITVDGNESCFEPLAVRQPHAQRLAGAQRDAAGRVRLSVNACEWNPQEATREQHT